MDREQWVWAELNAFHSADVARQILEDIDNAVAKAVYLRKKERGEVEDNKFQEMWGNINGKKES